MEDVRYDHFGSPIRIGNQVYFISKTGQLSVKPVVGFEGTHLLMSPYSPGTSGVREHNFVLDPVKTVHLSFVDLERPADEGSIHDGYGAPLRVGDLVYLVRTYAQIISIGAIESIPTREFVHVRVEDKIERIHPVETYLIKKPAEAEKLPNSWALNLISFGSQGLSRFDFKNL